MCASAENPLSWGEVWNTPYINTQEQEEAKSPPNVNTQPTVENSVGGGGAGD